MPLSLASVARALKGLLLPAIACGLGVTLCNVSGACMTASFTLGAFIVWPLLAVVRLGDFLLSEEDSLDFGQRGVANADVPDERLDLVQDSRVLVLAQGAEVKAYAIAFWNFNAAADNRAVQSVEALVKSED